MATNTVAAAVGLRSTREAAPRRVRASAPDLRRVRELLALGLPWVPHALAQWALLGADRFLIAARLDAAAVGVYGLAYTLAGVGAMVVTEAGRAVSNVYGQALAEGREDTPAVEDAATLQVVLALLVPGAIALAAPGLLRAVFAPEYHGGAALIPWISLGVTFLGLYTVPVAMMTIYAGKSRPLPMASGAAALVNVVANLVLIPRSGLLGAAVATALAYGFLFMTVLLLAGRFVARPLPARPREPLVVATALVLGWALRAQWPDDLWAGLVATLPALVAAAAMAPRLLGAVRARAEMGGKGQDDDVGPDDDAPTRGSSAGAP